MIIAFYYIMKTNTLNREMKMNRITGYKIVDNKTGQQVGSIYTVKNRNRARARADKMSNNYGSYRYNAQPIFSNN